MSATEQNTTPLTNLTNTNTTSKAKQNKYPKVTKLERQQPNKVRVGLQSSTGKENLNSENNRENSDDIIITKSLPPRKDLSRPVIRKMNLNEDDFSRITKGNMLTDVHINFCQQLLRDQFRDIVGMEDTSHGPVAQFSIFRGSFIQILHDGCLHWVCISNIYVSPEKREDSVDCYDSLSSSKTVGAEIAKQTAQCLFTESPSLNIFLQPVQQQTNGTNCGLFAIAFATCLANGIDPTTVRFDERKLRKHLVSCMEEKKMTMFPILNYEPKVCQGTNIKLLLHCICRLPYNGKDGMNMAKCGSCKKLFHDICMKLPARALEKPSSTWLCYNCGRAEKLKETL